MHKRSKLSYLFNGLATVGGAVSIAAASTTLSIDGHCGSWIMGCFDLSASVKAGCWTANAVGATVMAMGATGYLGRDKTKPNMFQRAVANINEAVNGPTPKL